MAQWATFAGVTGVVLVLLLVLSHLTQTAFSDPPDPSERERGRNADGDSFSSVSADEASPRADSPSDIDTDRQPRGDADASASKSALETDVDLETDIDHENDADPAREREVAVDASGPLDRRPEPERPNGRTGRIDPQSLSVGELLANVALSQGLFASVLLGAVVYTGIPADALGLEFSRSFLREGFVLGTAYGLVLYVANEIAAAVATRFGFDHEEDLRELLAPETLRGWLVLLLVVLPIIAVFEELLFRAALIGAVATGFGVSPWLLAVVSSVAFAVGHGMQGSVGVVVTGVLGFVLAAIFVVTGSLLVVIVAHYLVNALEFVVHEGLEFDWADSLEN
ncbi:CPBP family intramembrane glutamic endopeptidase [Haloterrigena alkaliphila]|uniref:CPBP family intramembrane metalloprotease n=1 Tax=Haloterrigena alkaliphila TaxID=2816475 RepID=A0A8A2V968_9EURY|nr:type II CAAX endopeptidase family protein [Haloterrigena alkaliphila]QSW98011.1 CPBP family glutamic-type intramembrane protease [Haloterrigena alkaliphila]